MPTTIRWRLVDPAKRDRIAAMVPSAPLPWSTHPDKPWTIIDANGKEVALSPRTPAETVQTIGIIVAAVNTLGGYVAG